jgi:hypothetical protein
MFLLFVCANGIFGASLRTPFLGETLSHLLFYVNTLPFYTLFTQNILMKIF